MVMVTVMVRVVMEIGIVLDDYGGDGDNYISNKSEEA